MPSSDPQCMWCGEYSEYEPVKLWEIGGSKEVPLHEDCHREVMTFRHGRDPFGKEGAKTYYHVLHNVAVPDALRNGLRGHSDGDYTYLFQEKEHARDWQIDRGEEDFSILEVQPPGEVEQDPFMGVAKRFKGDIPAANLKKVGVAPIVYGTCQYGHTSKPVLVKRLSDNAAMVRCTATSKSSKKPCSDVYVMFDYRQESKEASYGDVQAKAVRLKNQGKVAIIRIDWDIVASRVIGDSGKTYEVVIERQDPDSESVSMWTCECAWSQYAWGRTRQWTKYEGRMCAHALATLFEVQSRENRKQSPDYRWMQVEASKEEDDYWNTPEHDYDPSWDYEIDEKPDERVKAAAEKTRPKLEETARHLGMGKPTIHYIKGGKGVATYAYGTAPHNVLMVDAKQHAEGVDPQDLDQAVHDSLFHEFAHGVQDWLGADSDEDEAEGFARAVSEHGNHKQRATELENGIRKRMGSRLFRDAATPQGKGDCYEKAFETMMDFHDKGLTATLVHATVMGRGPVENIRFGHAWVEVEDTVFDFANGLNVVMRKERYYELGKVEDPHYYTFEEMATKALRTKVYGPWE